MSEEQARTTKKNRWVVRWTQDLPSPSRAWSTEKQSYGNCSPGFINTFAYSILAGLTLLSLHHALQTTFHNNRYLVTDLYFVFWATFALWSGLCVFGMAPVCLAPWPGFVTVIIVYRLVEIVPRELWVILYRNTPLTATSRVLVVAILNYATVIGLFGYLYNSGASGYAKAATISLTFSFADSEMFSLIEAIQAGYCFIFSVIIIAIFVSRVSPGST